jgi:hypothetical protein
VNGIEEFGVMNKLRIQIRKFQMAWTEKDEGKVIREWGTNNREEFLMVYWRLRDIYPKTINAWIEDVDWAK